jgi:hypothetical protein
LITVAAQSDTIACDDRPSWLDRILGTGSPAFTFRRGGSAVTGGISNDANAQQSASAATSERSASRQRG